MKYVEAPRHHRKKTSCSPLVTTQLSEKSILSLNLSTLSFLSILTKLVHSKSADSARSAIEMTKETNRRLEESMKIMGTREESRKRSFEMEIYLQQSFRRLGGVAKIIVRDPTFRARMLLPPLQ